jgi:hypothetical protein
MTRPFAARPTLALLAALAGCAATPTMDARYDASLQRWKGATRAELVATWGAPLPGGTADGSEVLTYVRRTDIDQRIETPSIAVATVGNRASVISGAPDALSDARPPIACTTHFLLKGGRVDSWTFEGLGCGAPH